MTWIIWMAFGLGMFAGYMVKYIAVESERTEQRIRNLVWWDIPQKQVKIQ